MTKKQNNNAYDGVVHQVGPVRWLHGTNDQFEFWTYTTTSGQFTYDVARRLQDGFWSIYQHDRRGRKGGTVMLNAGSRNSNLVFKHGIAYHIDSSDAFALMNAISTQVVLDSYIESEPVYRPNCPFCVAEHDAAIRLNIARDLELAELALVKAREHIFAARDKAFALYSPATPGIHPKETAEALYYVGSYLEQAAAQAGNGWVHQGEGARGRIDAVRNLLKHREDIKL